MVCRVLREHEDALIDSLILGLIDDVLVVPDMELPGKTKRRWATRWLTTMRRVICQQDDNAYQLFLDEVLADGFARGITLARSLECSVSASLYVAVYCMTQLPVELRVDALEHLVAFSSKYIGDHCRVFDAVVNGPDPTTP